MEKYCNNCGNYGHIYKDCRHPVLSYGIILYCNVGDCRDKVVMVERKDSLSYIEFIRGKYNSQNNYEYIKLLISRMTNKEKNNLKIHNFDKLWNDLWIHTDSINKKIQKEYHKSKNIFNLLKNGAIYNKKEYNLDVLINESIANYLSNEWEIPKGRRKKYENNKECAIREFEEETNIKPSQYNLYNNIIPLVEEYKGINNVRYKHIYYIGEIKEICKLNINMDNREQYTEIKDIQWFDETECLERIRSYQSAKKKVIVKIFNFLKVKQNYVSLK